MQTEIDIKRLLSSLSVCLDFSSRGLHLHHQQVAYLSYNLAGNIGLSQKEKEDIYTTALIHDIGVRSWSEKEKLHSFEIDRPWDHCLEGSKTVSKADFLKPLAKIILSHHDSFCGGNMSGLSGDDIPVASRIIHLADRVCVLLEDGKNIFSQTEHITASVERLSGSVFDPVLVDAFKKMSLKESFWLDLTTTHFRQPWDLHIVPKINIRPHDFLQLAEIFAAIIDRKSTYTYFHSRRVSKIAAKIASAIGFSGEDAFLITVSGLLHDLGKLSVPVEILEKPSRLNNEEFNIIKQHAYYTYHLLNDGGVPPHMSAWAAFHHEKLDGSGYPFHLSSGQLPRGSKIITAADIFTALKEDRPYRPGMSKKEIIKTMTGMAADKSIDPEVLSVFFDIYDQVEKEFYDAELI